MPKLFVSYAREDRAFTTALARRLGAHYEVFVDVSAVLGGQAWERRIEQGIRECAACLVVVTPASGRSRWVARETHFAESLKKPLIPLLVSAELPLRLLDRQFVDFRGTTEAGWADLLAALAPHATPDAASQREADLLLGAAVRARLARDWLGAAALARRAQALDPALLPDGAELWAALADAAPRAPVTAGFRRFELVERTSRLEASIFRTRPTYRWTVSIDGPEGFLEIVDSVEYRLHRSFADRVQIVRDRASGFALTRLGWGEFELELKVVFVDAAVLELPFMLSFAAEHRETVALP